MHCGPCVTVNVTRSTPACVLTLAGAGIAALIVDSRIAVAALAKMALDAELRILEQVFVDRVLARDRHEPIALAFGERIALNDDLDARSRLDAQHEIHGRIVVDVSRKLRDPRFVVALRPQARPHSA